MWPDLILIKTILLQGIGIVLWSAAVTMQRPSRQLADRLVDRFLPQFQRHLVRVHSAARWSLDAVGRCRVCVWARAWAGCWDGTGWQHSARAPYPGLPSVPRNALLPAASLPTCRCRLFHFCRTSGTTCTRCAT